MTDATLVEWSLVEEAEPGMCSNCDKDPCICFVCYECGLTYPTYCLCERCEQCRLLPASCPCQWREPLVSQKIWGLPKDVRLWEVAADFYLLYDLWVNGQDQGKLDKFLTEWVPIVAAYTDMVVGGELRYAAECASIITAMKKLGDEGKPLADALYTHGEPRMNQSRGHAWRLWKEFRVEHGVQALEWAQVMFRSFRRSNIGGKRWATIAEQLLHLESGTISPRLFLDLCWGLEHNNGCYFSKLPWDRKGLRYVLDAARESNVEALYKYASDSIVEQHKEMVVDATSN